MKVRKQSEGRLGRGYNHAEDCACRWCTSTGGTSSRNGAAWVDAGLRHDGLGYSWRYSDDVTRPTKCKSCGGEVFFVRHNGGSVWLDELGPPWPKHGCFNEEAYRHLQFDFRVEFGHPVFVPLETLTAGLSAPHVGVINRHIRIESENAILELRFARESEHRYAIVDSAIRPEYIVGSLCASGGEGNPLVIACEGRVITAQPVGESSYCWLPYSDETSVAVGQIILVKKLGLCRVGRVDRTRGQVRMSVRRAFSDERTFVVAIAKPLFLARKGRTPQGG